MVSPPQLRGMGTMVKRFRKEIVEIIQYSGFPKKVLGMYILLADDFEEGFESSADWEPRLYPYQQEGANVLFFTFINPESMAVPESFKKLGQSYLSHCCTH